MSDSSDTFDATITAPDVGGRRTSLRWKIVALCAVSASLVAAVLTVTLVTEARDVLVEQLRGRGRAISRQLTQNLGFAVADRNDAVVRSATENLMRETPDVLYVVFRDGNAATFVQVRGEDAPADVAALAGVPRFDAGAKASDRELHVGAIAVVEVAERLPGELGADPAKPAKDPGFVQVGMRADLLSDQVTKITTRALLLAMMMCLACLAAAYLLARMLTSPIYTLRQAAAGMARGDLRHTVVAKGNDEIGELAESFQTMSEGLRGMAVDLQKAALEVETEAAQILSTASQQAAMSAQQASAITETSTTVTEIAQTSKQATEHADNVIQIAQKSEELSQEGQRAVDQTKQGIEALGEQVRTIALTITKLSERTLQIGEIIATVKDVAEQSNILALNAAIEASKAGEQGRGFAVVATEMRHLAEQSKLAASQVRAILGEIQTGTRAAVDATEEGAKRARAAMALAHTAGDAIVGLADVIRESSLAARQIANNTRQQTIGVEQIVAAISEVSGAMSDSVEGTRSIERVTTNLSTVSKKLSAMVTRYQV